MEYINNFDLRKPYKYDFERCTEKQNRTKSKYLILMHYPNGKHHLIIVNETERQLLKRVKAICFQKQNKIAYLNVYEIWQDDRLQPYGEFTYRCK